jgi:hypothetical protein
MKLIKIQKENKVSKHMTTLRSEEWGGGGGSPPSLFCVNS